MSELMNTPLVHDRNTDQAAYWNGPAGQRWIERQETQDVVLAPASAVLFERALVGEGNRVIDVGCGCGGTTIALAKRVGPKGHVTGVDISAPMLARARERAGTGLPLDFVLADATVHPFKPARADVVTSRFGVRFLARPAVSSWIFRKAWRPAVRVACACG